MIGSLDCMHWTWKNCPTAWQGAFQGKEKSATVILEAVASKSLWIWHTFYGMPGVNNDLNVLERSPLLDDVVNGVAPEVEFTVNADECPVAMIASALGLIEDEDVHYTLRNDLIEHIWRRFGERN
ncbi:hypothetical protein PHMEG_00039083 [Phytophthora megakarya]|uniref:Uncharacterized protein n=1 Tax=Phytophthora megakarya TaxID=4795 RepID=A0A225UGG0_9STRA|nr:hypothetical protein PHMEG_00039083 [Phytophthora megakarya]